MMCELYSDGVILLTKIHVLRTMHGLTNQIYQLVDFGQQQCAAKNLLGLHTNLGMFNKSR